MTRVADWNGPAKERVRIVAAITGLAADAHVVRQALDDAKPAKVLLGVPYEDLDAIRATSGKEAETPFESADLDDVYLERLKKFGQVQTPPPDLYVAYRFATDASLPLEAIDLGDEAYTEAYTKNVGFLEVMRSSRNQKRIPNADFSAVSADEFVREWDQALNFAKGLRRVQEVREDAMAKGIAAHARAGPVFALVPLARVAGIERRLQIAGWTKTV